MKTAYCGFVLAAALVCASCSELYNGQSGEGTFVYMPPEGPAVPAQGSSFDVPGKFPALGSARLGVYNASGKMIREAGGSGKLEFSLPAGGPYWLDFSAPVIHDLNPETDPFPFVKSFGATVKIEKVTAGSSREISLPLRVRETAIMVPYSTDGEVNETVFVPLYELPAEYPVPSPPYLDKGTEEICFDFDPFGRLFAMENIINENSKYVYRRDTLFSQGTRVNTLLPSSTEEHGLAFNVLNGRLYYAYLSSIPSHPYYLSEYDGSSSGPGTPIKNGQLNLASALITIDEEGFLYGVVIDQHDQLSLTARKQGAYWAGSPVLSMKSILEDLLEVKGYAVETIADLKALNGYLYILFGAGDGKYCAAIPLESVRAGTLKDAWFAGGAAFEEGQTGAPDPYSTAGFYGPEKFVGWGPDRLYVYDVWYDDSRHRIVELNLRDRKISKAGLVAGVDNSN